MSKSKKNHQLIRWLLRVLCRRRDGSLRPWRQSLLLLFVLIIILVLIVLYGLVPGFNRLLGRPAAMVFLNPYPRESIVEFNGKTYQLEGNAPLNVMGIYGRMPRTETLHFLSQENNVDYKVKVPLHAGETVLVNPFSIQSFGVLKCEEGGFSLTAELKSLLIQSLLEGKKPSVALQLAEECRATGKRLLLAFTDDEIVRSSSDFVRDQHFDINELVGSASGMEGNRMTITRCISHGVLLGDATIYYRKGRHEVADCSFVLDFGSNGEWTPCQKARNIPLEYRDFTPLTGTAECHVSEEEKQVLVRMIMKNDNFSVKRYQRMMKGVWSYEASYDKKEQNWSWRWIFTARDTLKICTLRLVIDDKDKVDIQYKEKRD